ncbi:PLC-like phosphodiesterase [Coniochaeta sp. 2T2.1]|nr:PLC-like phosphodiesterase [Coniochaeta sp. 2T2.1]
MIKVLTSVATTETSAESFATALTTQKSGSDDSIKLPQAIAHRGYSADFPENTLAAFTAAVDVGAHAIETDIRLSKDNVVVLSHDLSLKRCFGVAKTLAQCDWDYLSTLETLAAPKQHMPRLADLLSYLAQPGNESVWLLLDIKRDDDPDLLLSRTAAAISSVAPPSTKPWRERIVLGAWSSSVIDKCRAHLPGFNVALIGVYLPEANRLLREESGVWFNMLLLTLLGSSGGRFIEEARRKGRNLFVWTVNKEGWMHWCIRKGVDGVITDDPKKFLAVCEEWKSGGGVMSTPVGMRVKTALLRLMIVPFRPLFWYMHWSRRRQIEKSSRKEAPSKA